MLTGCLLLILATVLALMDNPLDMCEKNNNQDSSVWIFSQVNTYTKSQLIKSINKEAKKKNSTCQVEHLLVAVQMSPWTERSWKQVGRTEKDGILELSSDPEHHLRNSTSLIEFYAAARSAKLQLMLHNSLTWFCIFYQFCHVSKWKKKFFLRIVGQAPVFSLLCTLQQPCPHATHSPLC